MFLQILTSKSSWLFDNKQEVLKNLKEIKNKIIINIISNSNKISKKADIIFVLSYYKIISKRHLKKNNNIYVIHDSNLPNGRGMSPLFNQILKGKREIISTVFKCEENIDDGKIAFKKKFYYPDNIVYDEIKKLQIENNIILIKKFILLFEKKKVKLKKQSGKATYFKKISAKKNNINKNKSISSQFQKIRTRDNKYFRAFFIHKKRKFFIKIEPEEK